MKENYLTKKPQRNALNSTLLLVLALLYGSYIYLNDIFHAEKWMPASFHTVFEKGEYWRAWTTLFAHGDLGHVMSNLLLFFPFAYFLTGYFGYLFFPLFGFLVGGFINLLVLRTLPENVFLIGVSGVVYWLGATWMALSFYIDRRDSRGKSLVKVIGISAILFIPDTFHANVSYLSHLVGYAAGVISGGSYYYIFKKKIRLEDIMIEFSEDEDEDEDYYEIQDDNEELNKLIRPVTIKDFDQIR